MTMEKLRKMSGKENEMATRALIGFEYSLYAYRIQGRNIGKAAYEAEIKKIYFDKNATKTILALIHNFSWEEKDFVELGQYYFKNDHHLANLWDFYMSAFGIQMQKRDQRRDQRKQEAEPRKPSAKDDEPKAKAPRKGDHKPSAMSQKKDNIMTSHIGVDCEKREMPQKKLRDNAHDASGSYESCQREAYRALSLSRLRLDQEDKPSVNDIVNNFRKRMQKVTESQEKYDVATKESLTKALRFLINDF